ncbi:MAG: UDP-2,3-diacylglucosamine diphosphatase LpxI [Chitinispirillales bacterium]|jgi:DUF1009 family protein|nr:UDP-2,3-diacylglucosamine diphosphatase LpxI [Chitinispirillales bacterium]
MIIDETAQKKLGKIGLIAGGGNFPWLLVSSMLKNDTPFAVAGLHGFADGRIREAAKAKNQYMEAHVSDFAKIVRFFKKEGVATVIIIGNVDKRAIKFNNIDIFIAIFKLLFYKKKNDAIFRIIVRNFEKKGFRVVGIQDAMPSLTAKPGLLTKTEPTAQNLRDIEYAVEKCREFGKTDAGQSIVVKDGRVIGKEFRIGTDALMKEALAAKNGEKGGVMAKLAKPGQEERGDIPAIGFKTIEQLIGAKIDGIVVDSGYKSIIEEKEKLAEFADENGVFIMAV